MILLSDPRVAAVPADDCGEELTDLRQIGDLFANDSNGGHSCTSTLVRKELATRLLDAQSRLPDGIRLLVAEGYRDLARQGAIFEEYEALLRHAHPDWPGARVLTETSKFVAPIGVAPHSTGGAVDLTLCAPDGAELDMGTPLDATPEASGDACFTAAERISARARENRQLLSGVLAGVGLVNYPTEWWHWSYGDRYWALLTGAPAAIYGPVTLP
ncbi:MAG: dipeptidase [Actinomycetia bacterium]|jgi:D-alanyl-D-alanine dipeptidase|nr:dipeptidase [Actinomycetes bacterium]